MMDLLAEYKESLRPILSFSSTLFVSADSLKARSVIVIPTSSKNGRIFSSICRFKFFSLFWVKWECLR